MSPANLSFPLLLISLKTILQEPLPPIDWLVEPLIAKGDRVVLYGEFGSMKSWLLLHLALHVAAGQPWLGKFSVSRPMRVLYVDEEMNERTLRRRLKRLAAGAGLTDEGLEFRAMSRAGLRFNELGANALLSALAKSQFDPEVVIVESFRRVLVGSENDAEDVSAFWRNVEPLLKAGKTFIISHHMRKPNSKGSNAPRDRASGSTDILAGADTAFAIERLAGDGVVIEAIKLREAEEASPFVVSLYDEGQDSPVEMRYEASAADFKSVTSQQVRAATLAEECLAAAPDRIAETATVEAYVRGKGIAERTAERALPTLSKWGRVTRLRRGWWQLVDLPNA